jgi:hypothetical protein
MRIKLRCPHCGDWFTLNLGIENGEAEGRESGERQSEEEEPDEEPARQRALRSRARLIASVSVVAAVVLIVWVTVALRPDRQAGTTAPDEVSARPAVTDFDGDQAHGVPRESDVMEAAQSDADIVQGQAAENEAGGRAGDASPTDLDAFDEAPSAADLGASGETASSADLGVSESAPSATEAAPTDAGDAEVVSSQDEPPEAVSSETEPPEEISRAAFEHEILEVELVALERCWIRVKADGVVVADATLDAGERRSWRADGLFMLDVGAGDAVQLYLNGEDLGTAGPGPRVVEGLRLTKDGIRGP